MKIVAQAIKPDEITPIMVIAVLLLRRGPADYWPTERCYIVSDGRFISPNTAKSLCERGWATRPPLTLTEEGERIAVELGG